MDRLMEAETSCKKCNSSHLERFFLREGYVSVEYDYEMTRRKGYIAATPEEIEDDENTLNCKQELSSAVIYKNIMHRFRDSS